MHTVSLLFGGIISVFVIFSLVFALIISFLFILVSPFYYQLDTISLKHISNVDQQVLTQCPSHWNYYQSLNNCGSYATAAAIRALDQRDVSSEEVVAEMAFRLPDRFTHPWGIISTILQY